MLRASLPQSFGVEICLDEQRLRAITVPLDERDGLIETPFVAQCLYA